MTAPSRAGRGAPRGLGRAAPRRGRGQAGRTTRSPGRGRGARAAAVAARRRPGVEDGTARRMAAPRARAGRGRRPSASRSHASRARLSATNRSSASVASAAAWAGALVDQAGRRVEGGDEPGIGEEIPEPQPRDGVLLREGADRATLAGSGASASAWRSESARNDSSSTTRTPGWARARRATSAAGTAAPAGLVGAAR